MALGLEPGIWQGMGTEELASGRSTDLEIAKGCWVAWLCCQAQFSFPFPLSVFPQCLFCAEQTLQTVEGSVAVSSCEQLSWREPGVLPIQTVPGFCLLRWDKTLLRTGAGTSWGQSFAFSRDSEPRLAAEPGSAPPSGAGRYRENRS